MKDILFTGSGVAIVTPFRGGAVNFPALGHLIDRQISGGTDAIIVCGTTGEAATMTQKERMETIAYCVDRVAGCVPVIAGTGSNDTAYGIELSREAKNLGADALLLVTPYYNKASQKGLVIHYNQIAEAAKMPIILYNVPSRTGVEIKPSTIAELAQNPYIVGVKQANGNISSVAQIAEMCDIDIYSGNDDQIVPILSLGGKGVISVLSNILPQQTHDIVAKWFAGDPAGSLALQLKWLEVCNALFSDVNPIPVKEAMNLMGMDVGECRLPLCGMTDAGRQALAAVLKKHGLMQ
ncbi:MAG: 4-hydroxy-tetrahydrodipicolinate synthase [Clostridiales bacterium]|nr:4-hydroxy-tetrahydrodipicolinate synthase [Clostridiales bacterium]